MKLKPVAYVTVSEKNKSWEEKLENLNMADPNTSIEHVTAYARSAVQFYNRIKPEKDAIRTYQHSRIGVQTERKQQTNTKGVFPVNPTTEPAHIIQTVLAANTYSEIDKATEDVVLYAINHIPSPDAFFEPQTVDSVFYKAYDALCGKGTHLGSYFANRLKDVYEIQIPVQ